MSMKLNKTHIVVFTSILLAIAFVLHGLGFGVANHAVLISSSLIAGYPIARKAIQAIRMKAFSIELLVTIAVVGALMIGEYVESAAVTFLFLFGAFLEARTLEKTRSSLKSLMDMTPLQATVIRDGVATALPIEEVRVGDHIRIQSG